MQIGYKPKCLDAKMVAITKTTEKILNSLQCLEHPLLDIKLQSKRIFSILIV